MSYTVAARVVWADESKVVSVTEPFVLINLNEVRTASFKDVARLREDSQKYKEMFERSKPDESEESLLEVFELTFANGEKNLYLFRHDHSMSMIPWRTL